MRLRVAVVVLALAAAGPGRAAGEVAAFAADAERAHGAGALLAGQVAEVTGVSLSPIVGMSVLGAWRWLGAPAAARAGLPWHQQPWFWGLGLALLAATFLADKVPVLRGAVKSVRLYENKVFGLLAVAALLEGLAAAAASPLRAAGGQAQALLVPVARAGVGAEVAAAAPGPALLAAAAAAGLVVMGAVWLLGHAVDVLVLLSPFAPLDHLLRAARNGVLLLLAGLTALSPTAGGALAALVILAALLLAGWTLRLCVFGAIMSGDFLTFHRVAPVPGRPVLAFATNLAGVPRRTCGRLEPAGGGAVFSWRPWLVLARRRVPLPGAFALGVGLVSPVALEGAAGGGVELARLPPRYRGAEAQVAGALGGVAVVDVPLVRGLKAALAWLRGAPSGAR